MGSDCNQISEHKINFFKGNNNNKMTIWEYFFKWFFFFLTKVIYFVWLKIQTFIIIIIMPCYWINRERRMFGVFIHEIFHSFSFTCYFCLLWIWWSCAILNKADYLAAGNLLKWFAFSSFVYWEVNQRKIALKLSVFSGRCYVKF